MDDIVLRAMQKWPNVPRVYGWLQLDRRGEWLLKNRSGRFDRITNRALASFIGRNYACDGEGRWYFQNGPQRVFVALHYTPWIYRVDDRCEGLVSQTGMQVKGLRELYLDEHGALLVLGEAGIGLLLDRDLPSILERLQQENPAIDAEEALVQVASSAAPLEVQMLGARVRLSAVHSNEVPDRFGFVASPAPAAGEPEC